MTVIAAIRFNSIPILMGDFVISSPAGLADPMWVPTNPNAPKSKIPGYQITGLRRKVECLHPHLCVGWSGSALAANVAFRRIIASLQKNEPSWNLLEAVLSEVTEYRGDNAVELVGWLGQPAIARCFIWSSNAPETLQEGSEYITGGGANVLKEILQDTSSNFSPTCEDFDKALLKALGKFTRFLGSEIFSGQTLENLCGYGLEIAIGDQEGFSFIDEITFLSFDILAKSREQFQIKPNTTFYKYKCFGMYSVVQVTHTVSGVDGLSANNTFVTAITPVYDSMNDLDVAAIGRLPIKSSYYGVFFRMLLWDKRCLIGALAVPEDNSDEWSVKHSIKNGKDYFELKVDIISQMLRDVP